MAPTRRDPERTRRAILDAAEMVFAANGYAGAASSEIAETAGVTKSLIHHHYGSKSRLWAAVSERCAAQYVDVQQGMMDRPWGSVEECRAAIRGSLGSLFEYLQSNPRVVRFLSWEQLQGSADQRATALADQTVTLLRAAQEAGYIRRDVDAVHVMVAFYAVIEHWFQAKSVNEARLAEDFSGDGADGAYVEDVIEIYLRGVMAY